MASTASSLRESLLKWRMSYFEILLALTQISGFATIILCGFVFNTMNKGIVWPQKGKSDGNPQNFHGMFMIVGLVYFQGEALLSYRLYRHEAKLLSKFVHVVFHLLAMGFFSTALAAAILQKNIDGNNNFVSAHSWIGIACMSIYLVQFLFGFLNFILPGISDNIKARFLPIHRIVGSISFLLCCIQAIIGHTQYELFADFQRAPAFKCSFSLVCPFRLDIIFNFSLISIIFYCVSVLLVVLPPAWKREKTPDEMK